MEQSWGISCSKCDTERIYGVNLNDEDGPAWQGWFRYDSHNTFVCPDCVGCWWRLWPTRNSHIAVARWMGDVPVSGDLAAGLEAAGWRVDGVQSGYGNRSELVVSDGSETVAVPAGYWLIVDDAQRLSFAPREWLPKWVRAAKAVVG